jgi:hypothetical protein
MKARRWSSLLLTLVVSFLWASSSPAGTISLTVSHNLYISATPLDGGPAPYVTWAPGTVFGQGLAYGSPIANNWLEYQEVTGPGGVYTYSGGTYLNTINYYTATNPIQIQLAGTAPPPIAGLFGPNPVGFINITVGSAREGIIFSLDQSVRNYYSYKISVTDDIFYIFHLNNDMGYRFYEASAGIYVGGLPDPPYVFNRLTILGETWANADGSPLDTMTYAGGGWYPLFTDYQITIGMGTDSRIYPDFTGGIQGYTGGMPQEPLHTPLPGTLVLLGSGIIGLFLGGRKLRR